jgi:hypothetical protein
MAGPALGEMHGELLALAVETGAALMAVIMEADVTAAHGPKPSLIRTGRPCGTATNPARSLQEDARTCKIDYGTARRQPSRA